MARYSANAPINFELPAPVCVCALLVAGALTKGGHAQWAIGATILLYVTALSSAVRKTRRSTTAAAIVAVNKS